MLMKAQRTSHYLQISEVIYSDFVQDLSNWYFKCTCVYEIINLSIVHIGVTYIGLQDCNDFIYFFFSNGQRYVDMFYYLGSFRPPTLEILLSGLLFKP